MVERLTPNWRDSSSSEGRRPESSTKSWESSRDRISRLTLSTRGGLRLITISDHSDRYYPRQLLSHGCHLKRQYHQFASMSSNFHYSPKIEPLGPVLKVFEG